MWQPVVLLSLLLPLAGQIPANLECRDGTGVARELSVEDSLLLLGPERATTDDEDAGIDFDGMVCAALIEDCKGNRVLEARDRGLRLHEVSGTDLNGDGHPDLVLEGYSGGMHCCLTYWIVALKPPRLLCVLSNRDGMAFTDIDGDGSVEILARDHAFDCFLRPCSISPSPMTVLRAQGDKLIDVSRQFPQMFEEDLKQAQKLLSPDRVARFRTDQPLDVGDYLEAKQGILSMVVTYLYSGRGEKAWQTLEEMWPPAEVPTMRVLIERRRAEGILKSLDACGSSDRHPVSE